MASNSRKRAADCPWEMAGRGAGLAKAPRLMHAAPPSAPIVTQRKKNQARRNPRSQQSSFSRDADMPSPHLASLQPLNPPIQMPRLFKPEIRYSPHPESRLCQDFHWIPYPMGLMPYDSWHTLHNRANALPPSPFRCPRCRAPRKLTSHIRKIFLVAERLTWEEGQATIVDKDQNEELNWAVNYELGILEPTVEDPEHIPGGKKSQANRWHPYQNEYEMKQALKLIYTSENITEMTFALWMGFHMGLQKMEDAEEVEATSKWNSPSGNPRSSPRKPLRSASGNRTRMATPETLDLTVSPDHTPRKPNTHSAFGMPTPPSSFTDRLKGKAQAATSSRSSLVQPVCAKTSRDMLIAEPTVPKRDQDRRIVSYKTLQDFYSLLDQIERTSYVGALFLEGYAENLQNDMCRDCWFKVHVQIDEH